MTVARLGEEGAGHALGCPLPSQEFSPLVPQKLSRNKIILEQTNAGGYKCTCTNTVTQSYSTTYRHVSEDAHSPGIAVSPKIICFRIPPTVRVLGSTKYNSLWLL